MHEFDVQVEVTVKVLIKGVKAESPDDADAAARQRFLEFMQDRKLIVESVYREDCDGINWIDIGGEVCPLFIDDGIGFGEIDDSTVYANGEIVG